MALPMVHLETAYLAANELKPSDMSAYLLGAIAPDGVHMRSPYSGEMKQASHYGLHGKTDQSDSEVARNLLSLAEKGDYFLGYAVHLYTDLLWYRHVYLSGGGRRYRKPDGSRDSELYYAETDKLDLWLYDVSPHRAGMWRLLEQARGKDTEVLSAAEAEAWRDRTLLWYERHRKRIGLLPRPRKLTEEEISEFCKMAAKRCTELFLNERKTLA